ncbi:hypothetical protein MLD38_034202 [Melastoma candidum]|uniref:Uncharacterized protein n=1 Tax=Melastoma candidum TaxID=119954 RepID=A0ACB9M966_9MYRT|nr:hypothetical protein MLD38_034202 [Melastoma candidum]
MEIPTDLLPILKDEILHLIHFPDSSSSYPFSRLFGRPCILLFYFHQGSHSSAVLDQGFRTTKGEDDQLIVTFPLRESRDPCRPQPFLGRSGNEDASSLLIHLMRCFSPQSLASSCQQPCCPVYAQIRPNCNNSSRHAFYNSSISLRGLSA